MSTIADLPKTAVRKFNPKPRVYWKFPYDSGAEATWLVPVPDFLSFAQTVAGKVETVGGPGGAITRVVPLQHPEFPWMYAQSFDATQEGWDGKAGFYQWAFVTVHFEIPKYDMGGNTPFQTISFRNAERTVPVAKAAASLAGGGSPALDPGILACGFDYEITMHQLPALNEGFWLALSGHVNNATYRNIPAGQLLYRGISGTRSTTIGGITTYEVTFSLSASSVPWNYEYDATGAGSNCTVGGALRYTTTDLSVLFG